MNPTSAPPKGASVTVTPQKQPPPPEVSLKEQNKDELLVNVIGTHNKEDDQHKMYTVYIITVESTTGSFVPWYIGRRYNDFFLLDSVLRRMIKAPLPELPSKTLANKLDPMVIMQRMQDLQTYMSAILKIRPVVESPVMHRFLEENRKYAKGYEETVQNQKKCYLDVLIVEVSNLEDREMEEKSVLDFLPVVGKGYQRATLVELTLGEQEYNTTLIYNDLCPVWNEDCTFTYTPQPQQTFLTARIWDKGRYKDTMLGEVQIELNALPLKDIRPLFLPLQIGSRVVAGNLHVIVQRSEIPSEGMLAYHGPPLHSIPYRVDAGDIFLMNSSAWMTHGTKLATWSPWDHVAMAVSLPGKTRLRFFESTIEGVDADCGLESSVEAYVATSNLGVRRLHAARTPEMMKALADFIVEVKGRPYKQSPVQLFKAWAGSHEQDDSSSFFCSQLIAAAYQKMGLISGDICNSNFLPVDFASDLKGKLLRSKLGPLIVFPMRKKVSFETTLDIPVGSKSFQNSPKPPVALAKPSWPAPREGPPPSKPRAPGLPPSPRPANAVLHNAASSWYRGEGSSPGSLGGGVGGGGSVSPRAASSSSSGVVVPPKAGSYRAAPASAPPVVPVEGGDRESSTGGSSIRKEKKEKKSKREKKDKSHRTDKTHRRMKKLAQEMAVAEQQPADPSAAAAASPRESLGTSAQSTATPSDLSSSVTSEPPSSHSVSLNTSMTSGAGSSISTISTEAIAPPAASSLPPAEVPVVISESKAPSSAAVPIPEPSSSSTSTPPAAVSSSGSPPTVNLPASTSPPAALSTSPPAPTWAPPAPVAPGDTTSPSSSSPVRALSPGRGRAAALFVPVAPGQHRVSGH